MNNIFLFDIDGTLSYQKKIPESAISTLKMLRANGNIVMLATGRAKNMLNEVTSKIDIDGAILNNGAFAYLFDDIIYESPINKSTIITMYNNNLDIVALSHDFNRFKSGDIYDSFCNEFKLDLPNLVDLSYLDNNKIYSLGLYSYQLDDIDISSYTDLEFIKVNKYGYDIINKNINKSIPINKLRELYPNSKIISFGDNTNDEQMLKASDISIAMGNATDYIKSISTYTTKHVLDDGISYAINHLLREYI